MFKTGANAEIVSPSGGEGRGEGVMAIMLMICKPA